MLQSLRQNSRHVIIYVLFGILIAAFVISFGPGGAYGTNVSGGGSFAAKVDGHAVAETEFRAAYLVAGGGAISPQRAKESRLKEQVLDGLVRREILAQQAERLGMAASARDVEDMIFEGHYLGRTRLFRGMPAIELQPFADRQSLDAYVLKGGKFDYERFRTWTQNTLGLSVKRFIEIQQRELLARRMADMLAAGTRVSPDEVEADFKLKGQLVNLSYVRVPLKRSDEDVEIPTAEIDAYVKAHPDDLKKRYEERAFLYQKVDRQAFLRAFTIEVPKDAPKDKVEAAQKKAEEAAAKLKGGAAFAEVAKAYASDERAQKRGGLVGWRKKGFTALGDKLDEQVFAAKAGDLLGPEKTDRGFELVKVERFREGDVPLAEAEREIAEELVRLERAKQRARGEAEVILAKVKAGKSLAEQFPKKEGDDHEEEDPLARALGRQMGEPKLEETGLFYRRGDLVQGIGATKELAGRAFELKAGESAGPFEVPGGFVVVTVKERKEPDLAELDKRKADILREYNELKRERVLRTWAQEKCVEVRDAGKIRVSDEVLQYDFNAPGKQASAKYEPCVGLRLM
jgi:parvulin-like peptidyl-prolyl isomerase